jgi:ferritin-like metal-binding protein YciE
MSLNSLNDVFVEQVADLYSAEQQLIEALPKVAQAANSEELQQAFTHHLEETREHAKRLEEIVGQLGIAMPAEECESMKGLIAEGDKVIQEPGDPTAKDAALIAAAQRIEHYEIAGYGTARTLAGELDLGDAKSLLDETLNEESNADKTLTQIATGGLFRSGVNREAATAGHRS